MQRALSAVRLLTIWGRFQELQLRPGELGQIAVYFPIIGAVMGLGLSMLNSFAELYLPSELLSVALVAALVTATGAIHLEGLQETLSTFGRPAPLDTQKQRRGILGLIAVILIMHLKINSLEAIGDTRDASLLLVPMLARWSVVILLYGARNLATAHEQARPMPLVLNTALVLTLTVLIASETGLWIALCVSLAALIVRTIVHWHQAQVDCNHLGALVETNEALSLAAFATL